MKGSLLELSRNTSKSSGHFVGSVCVARTQSIVSTFAPSVSLVGHARVYVWAWDVPGSRGGVVERLALQEEVDLGESGALAVVTTPALAHQLVQVARTARRALHALEHAVVCFQVRQVRQHLTTYIAF